MENIKILLAEDDPNLGMLLSKFVRAKGYQCTLAIDGEEAYKAFTKDTYDFLILDVMMPKKDGFSVAKDVRGIDKDVPILFCSFSYCIDPNNTFVLFACSLIEYYYILVLVFFTGKNYIQ